MPRRRSLGAAGALVLAAWASDGRADDSRADEAKIVCLQAHTTGQQRRLEGRWLDAIARFKECSRSDCPDTLADDCARKYADLQAVLPSVIVAAQRPDGRDTTDARLWIDGSFVADTLPATAIDLDPGEHAIRLQHAGWTETEQTIVLREHEKDRRLSLRFREGARSSSSPVLPIAITAAGGVLTAIGATFLLVGLGQRNDLANAPCAETRTCSPDDVNSIDRDYWIGGIAAGIGVAALGFGIWQLVGAPAASSQTAGTPGGIRLSF